MIKITDSCGHNHFIIDSVINIISIYIVSITFRIHYPDTIYT